MGFMALLGIAAGLYIAFKVRKSIKKGNCACSEKCNKCKKTSK